MFIFGVRGSRVPAGHFLHAVQNNAVSVAVSISGIPDATVPPDAEPRHERTRFLSVPGGIRGEGPLFWG